MAEPSFCRRHCIVIEKSIQSKLKGEYHLGTKTLYTRAEMARKMALHLGYDPKLVLSGYMHELIFSEPRPNHNLLSSEKIQKVLKFKFTEVLELKSRVLLEHPFKN